jgi:TrmH family RNA methyltransferase
MMREISSPSNPLIKYLVRLRDNSFRKSEGLVLVEGFREISLAIKYGYELRGFYFGPEHQGTVLQQILRQIKEEHLAIQVSQECMDKIAMRESQGACLAIFAAKAMADQPSPPKGENCTVLVISGVEKPGNIGAMLRTAHGLGVDQVLLSGCSPDLYNPNLIRASLGAVFTQDLFVFANDQTTIDYLQKAAISSYALMLSDTAKNLFTTKLPKRIALVVGSEAFGLDSHIWGDFPQVQIPMRGATDSLNVSSSAAIALAWAIHGSRFR